MNRYEDLMYASKALQAARRLLMLPPQKERVERIAKAFMECQLGLPQIEHVEYNPAREWVATIRNAIDTSRCKTSPAREGLLWIRAEQFARSPRQREEFCDAVGELSHWIDRAVDFMQKQFATNRAKLPAKFVFPDFHEQSEECFREMGITVVIPKEPSQSESL